MVHNYYSDKIEELFGQLVTKGQFLEFPQFFVRCVFWKKKSIAKKKENKSN
jgi:hypothetical protein